MNILIYDHGLCTEIGVTLARAGHNVRYFTPWDEAFPKSAKAVVGKGLEGIERVDRFWQHAGWANLIACFDTFSQDIVEHAQTAYPDTLVWGAGAAERLEHDRSYTKQLQKKLGLPVNHYETIVGIEPLIDYLKKNKNKWVKTNRFRGDIETFFHSEWDASQAQFLGRLLIDFGAIATEIEFIVEDPIEGVEPGVDEIVVNGGYVRPYIVGYEDKDSAYLGHVTDTLPSSLAEVNEGIARYLGTTKSLVSTEVRVDSKRRGFLIDPCIRAPHPPLAVELELYSNFSNIITEGARGNVIAGKTAADYGAAIEIRSDWLADHWTEISFPKEMRSNVKLQNACRIDGKYYVLPGSFIACTVVGVGSTPQKAADEATEVASAVKLRGKTYDDGALTKLIKETVPEGVKHGIPF